MDDAATPVLIPMKLCIFCNTEQPVHVYKNHVISLHKDRVFRCDECNNYVDRKDIIIHMSVHAAEHMNENEAIQFFKRVGKIDLKVENIFPDTKNALKKSVVKIASPENISKTPNAESAKAGEKVTQENDFSDPSDIEYFVQLPESVFEAIDDSGDIQLNLDDNPLMIEPADCIANLNKLFDTEFTDEIPPETPAPSAAKSQKKTRTCPVCSKTYTASSSYFYHLKQHKDKEFECDVCGRKFGTKACLSQHITIHTGESSYKCKVCDKNFRSSASLYIHEQIHSGKKSHTCSHCQQSFRWLAQLKKHEKRHAEAKAHVCPSCGRGFKIHCDLLRHQRTHAAGSHACPTCHAHFAQLRYLKAHMLKKHSA